MPTHLFYDERLHRLRFSSLNITNFMWAMLGWKKFAVLVNPESARYVAPEQTSTDPATATIDKQKLDQYMLGQLAVEMLDGRLPFPSDDADNIAQSKAEFFQDPLKYFGPWKDYHKQLAQIIATMLHKNPNERWKSMEHVVTLLRAVESEGRALARYSYLQWLDNEDFFKDFYNHFFAHAEQAKAKFTHPDKQHEKLRDAMTAVLNFYDGNEPTSLAKLVPIHKEKSVTQEELEQFERSFLEVLKHRLDNATLEVKSGMAEKVQKSWQELFRAALQYLEKGWGAKSGDGLFTPPVQRHNGLQINQ